MRITAEGLTIAQAKALTYIGLAFKDFENVRHECDRWANSRYTQDTTYRSGFIHTTQDGRDLCIYVNLHRFRLSSGARVVSPPTEILSKVVRKELTTDDGREFTWIEVSISY